MDQVKRGPGRPRKDSYSVERTVVAPAFQPGSSEWFSIPQYLRDSAIEMRDHFTMPADLRLMIEARLGCNFTMKDGQVTATDGRRFTAVLHNLQVELKPS